MVGPRGSHTQITRVCNERPTPMDHQPTLNPEPSDHLTIIADPDCRAVLAHFRDALSAVASVEEIAEELPKQDHGGPAPTTVDLHHVTLPRLAAAGIVEYDPRSHTARYQGDTELEALLDALPDR